MLKCQGGDLTRHCFLSGNSSIFNFELKYSFSEGATFALRPMKKDI